MPPSLLLLPRCAALAIFVYTTFLYRVEVDLTSIRKSAQRGKERERDGEHHRLPADNDAGSLVDDDSPGGWLVCLSARASN